MKTFFLIGFLCSWLLSVYFGEFGTSGQSRLERHFFKCMIGFAVLALLAFK